MDEIPQTHTCSPEEQAPRTTQSRKRQIDSDRDDEPLAKRTQLTRKNLALFDKMGRKNTSEPTDESGSSKTTSITSSGFDLKAYKNGILLPLSSKAPTNHDTRRERSARSRGTASPTESEHGHYVDRIGNVGNEATMVVETSKLLKEYTDKDYTRAFNRMCTAFPKDVGFNNGLSAPQPDFVEGPRMEGFDPFPVDEYISGAVLYRDDHRSVTLAHFGGEWKGPGGDMKAAERQSSYDGAAFVYARNQALEYMGKSDLPGHAKVSTFAMDGNYLNIYSHFAIRTGDKTLYHQQLDESYNMKKYQEFRDGRKHLRNIQDDARDESYALRDQLIKYWEQRHSGLHPIEGVPSLSMPAMEPSGTYEDEASSSQTPFPNSPRQQDDSLSPKKSADCQEFPAQYDEPADYAISQDVNQAPAIPLLEDDQDDGQLSVPHDGEELAAGFTTSSAPTLTPVYTHSHQTRSKRQRNAHGRPRRASKIQKNITKLNQNESQKHRNKER